jgi:transketolase
VSDAPRKVTGFTWTVADANLITQDDAWGDALVEAGRRDPRIVAVTADLGSSTKIGRFRDAFPERYFNVGICEQNLMAVAAGLAATGLVPVVSTYAVFASLRAAEFLRNDVAYNRRDVKVVATLAGVSFGQGGPTHHAIEDLALLRAVPGLVVLAPCDGAESAALLEAALAHPGPVYLRLGRGIEPLVHGARPRVVIGEAIEVRPGTDVTVIACGPPVWHALAAAERAARAGASVRVLDMHTLKPLDEAAVRRAIQDTRRIVTAEDHSVIGGLGSAVADVIAASGKACGLRKLGHPDRWAGMGIPEDLIHAAGFDDDGILAAIEELLGVQVPTDEDWDG